MHAVMIGVDQHTGFARIVLMRRACCAFGSGGIRPVKFYQQAFTEGGRSVCLEVDGDVTGRHGRPRSSGPAGDGEDCGNYLGGIKGRANLTGSHPGTA